MTRFGRLLTAAALLAAAPLGLAQEGAGRSAALPSGQTPDAEVLRKLAAQLGGGGDSAELLELLKKFSGGGKLDEAGLKRSLEAMSRDHVVGL